MPTERRDVGVVFQSYALFPHLTVRENIAFGLKTGRRRFSLRSSRRRPSRHTWRRGCGTPRPCSASSGCSTAGPRSSRAASSSGWPSPGRWRPAPPCCSSTSRSRPSTPACAAAVRAELASLLRKLGTTVFYVTHDQEEAMLLADHLVVLDQGRVVQAGPPLDLYRRPATPFVASFLGEANLVEVSVERGTAAARTPLGRLAPPGGRLPRLGPGAPRGRHRRPLGTAAPPWWTPGAGPPRPRGAGAGERRRDARPLPPRDRRRRRAARVRIGLRSREAALLALRETRTDTDSHGPARTRRCCVRVSPCSSVSSADGSRRSGSRR